MNKKEFLEESKYMGCCWNCNGDVVGLKTNNNYIYSPEGSLIGCFHTDGKLFSPQGNYLGELININEVLDKITGKKIAVIDNDLTGYERLAVKLADKNSKLRDSIVMLDGPYGCEVVLEEPQRKLLIPDGYEDFKI